MTSQNCSVDYNTTVAGHDNYIYCLLERLPTELKIELLRQLPDFSCLNQLILTDNQFWEIIQKFQYSICEPVISNQLGALWKQARQLLVLQSHLNRAACMLARTVGVGILQGGNKVGIAEIVQIMSNAREVERVRGSFAAVARPYSTRFDADHIPAIDLVYEGMTTDNIFRIDRGYYSVWIILLACAPGLQELLERRKSKQPEPDKDLTIEEELVMHHKRHPNMDKYIQYQGKEAELDELLWVFGAAWLFRLLPDLGPEIIDRPCERWCMVNEDKLKAEARIQIHLCGSRKVYPPDQMDSDLISLRSLFMFGS